MKKPELSKAVRLLLIANRICLKNILTHPYFPINLILSVFEDTRCDIDRLCCTPQYKELLFVLLVFLRQSNMEAQHAEFAVFGDVLNLLDLEFFLWSFLVVAHRARF